MIWINKDAVMNIFNDYKKYQTIGSREMMLIESLQSLIGLLPEHEFELDQEVKHETD